MSVSSNDTIFALGTTTIYVRPGATLATYFSQDAGQNSTLLKCGSGGTLYVMGCPIGTTLAAATLAAASSHYLMGASEVLSLDGPITCYLANTGTATHSVFIIKGKTAVY